MSLLSEFRTKSFVEQISLLDDIESGKRVDALPELWALFREPLDDDAVDGAVADTLRAVLGECETEAVAGLRSADPRIRSLCVQIAKKAGFASAAPALAELADGADSPETLLAALSALAALRPSEHLPLFRRHLADPDPMVASVCIEAVGECRDTSAHDFLCQRVLQAEADDQYQYCDITTEKAILALSSMGTEESRAFLLSKIHHRNPTVRKLVAQGIVEMGPDAVPLLEQVFGSGSVDDRILAANALGQIGDRSAGDALVSAFDQGRADHPNIRFAVYEALGGVDSLKSLVCLLDGLSEDDESLLMAVVGGLDRKVNPGVIERLRTAMAESPQRRDKLLKAVVGARAVNLFEQLYGDAGLAEALLSQVEASQDPEAVEVFRQQLTSMAAPEAAAGAERLNGFQVDQKGRRLLAVDDSKSMTLFYRSVGADAGLEVVTAEDGKEALDRLERGESFDLVITDPNMPVMDGIELTRRLRANPFLGSLPVLMATTESETSQVALAREAGVTGFLRKPLPPETLKDKIQEVLG